MYAYRIIADCLLPASYLRVFTCVRILIPLRSLFFCRSLFFDLFVFGRSFFLSVRCLFFLLRSGSVVSHSCRLPAFFPHCLAFSFFPLFFPFYLFAFAWLSRCTSVLVCVRARPHTCAAKKKKVARPKAGRMKPPPPCLAGIGVFSFLL